MLSSTVLKIAITNVLIILIAFTILRLRIVSEPWDLALIVIVVFAAPIIGLWLTVSNIKHDASRGVAKWQIALGVALSLATVIYGVLVISIHR